MEKTSTHQKLIQDVQAFCSGYGISYTEFGRQALNDSAFYTRLVKGKSPTIDRMDRVYAFMDKERSKKAAEPAEPAAGGANDLLE